MNPLYRARFLKLTDPPDFAYKTPISRDRIPQFVEHLGPEAVILNWARDAQAMACASSTWTLAPFRTWTLWRWASDYPLPMPAWTP